jgi:hypothetical protein
VDAGETLTFGNALDGMPPERLAHVDAFLHRLDGSRAAPLLAEIADHRASMVDPTFVAQTGTFWTGPIEGPTVVESPSMVRALGEMRQAFAETPPRSIVLVGDPGVESPRCVGGSPRTWPRTGGEASRPRLPN